MRVFNVVAAGGIACLMAQAGHTAENGFYIGAARGETETRDKAGFGDVFDEQDSSFKVIAGWRPVDWFAVEGSYFDLGDVTLHQSVPDLSPFKLEQKGYFKHSGYMGHDKIVPLRTVMEKSPARVVEKAVFGMLPKNSLSKQVLRLKLRVYAGADHPHAAQQPAPLPFGGVRAPKKKGKKTA